MYVLETAELRLLIGGKKQVTGFEWNHEPDRNPDPPVDEDEIPPCGP